MKKILEDQQPRQRAGTIRYRGRHDFKPERPAYSAVYALMEQFREANSLTYTAVFDLALAALFAQHNTKALKVYEGQLAEHDYNFDAIREF